MSALREFLWILAMPCTQATRVISESLDRRLPWRLRTAIRVHQWTCKGCRRFRRHIEALRAALARKLREPGALPLADEPSLSNAARERIRQRLRDADIDRY
jgi:hypothetical protein